MRSGLKPMTGVLIIRPSENTDMEKRSPCHDTWLRAKDRQRLPANVSSQGEARKIVPEHLWEGLANDLVLNLSSRTVRKQICVVSGLLVDSPSLQQPWETHVIASME